MQLLPTLALALAAACPARAIDLSSFVSKVLAGVAGETTKPMLANGEFVPSFVSDVESGPAPMPVPQFVAASESTSPEKDSVPRFVASASTASTIASTTAQAIQFLPVAQPSSSLEQASSTAVAMAASSLPMTVTGTSRSRSTTSPYPLSSSTSPLLSSSPLSLSSSLTLSPTFSSSPLPSPSPTPSPSPSPSPQPPSFPTMWAGANIYFLYSLPPQDQDRVLSALSASGVKTVRIFVTSFSSGGKGTAARGSKDLELSSVGDYDDSILDQIDAMMPLLVQYGIRVLIALHDRWNLDSTWGICDAYCQKWSINGFYTNLEAQAAFDARLAHIVTHPNPYMNGRAWKDIPEAIYAFEIENEGQGDHFVNPSWWCDRATQLRSVMESSQVKVSTGGGQDFEHSAIAENFACPSIDIVALHSYSTDMNYLQSGLRNALSQANGKQILFEEFGSSSDKAGLIQKVADMSNALGVPWMVWEVSTVTKSKDFEFWTDDEKSWGALTNGAQAALAAAY